MLPAAGEACVITYITQVGTACSPHRLSDIDVQAASRIVVQEEQRLGAGGDDVVDAHGNQVDADGVVHAHLERQLQLRAHPVRASDQERVACSRDLAFMRPMRHSG